VGWDRFMRHVQYVVRDGNRVGMMHGVDIPSKDLYPELYAITVHNKATMIFCLEKLIDRSTHYWNISFI
jgi:hypothetical protein